MAWSYLVFAVVVGLLVALSAPLVTAALASGLAATVLGLRRARAAWRPLVRCARTCRTIHLSVGDRLLVTVTRPHLEEPCCDGPAG